MKSYSLVYTQWDVSIYGKNKIPNVIWVQRPTKQSAGVRQIITQQTFRTLQAQNNWPTIPVLLVYKDPENIPNVICV